MRRLELQEPREELHGCRVNVEEGDLLWSKTGHLFHETFLKSPLIHLLCICLSSHLGGSPSCAAVEPFHCSDLHLHSALIKHLIWF